MPPLIQYFEPDPIDARVGGTCMTCEFWCGAHPKLSGKTGCARFVDARDGSPLDADEARSEHGPCGPCGLGFIEGKEGR